jgi:alpha/beta superfamily hydrolase
VTFSDSVTSGGLALSAYVARPIASGGGAALVLCHGFPAGPGGAKTSAQTYPQLADRLSADTGWTVLTFTFRGAGGSEGNFSLGGWLEDVRAAVDFLADDDTVAGVWLAGSSTGGALVLCAAAADDRVRGVATLAAPAAFDDWAADPAGFLEACREIGVVRDANFPSDFEAWARELRAVRPVDVMGDLFERSVLVMHGADDDVVPIADARALVDASHGAAELRIINGAGHRLRHDPRAVALLTGWMERQLA